MIEISGIEDLIDIDVLEDRAVFTENIDGSDYELSDEGIIDCIEYSGVIDGNGYKLKNANPIAHINNGEIRDIEICGLNTLSDSNYTGGAVEINAGLIENIEVDLFVIDGENGVGGVAGFNTGIIRDVDVSGILHGNYDVGGVVGLNDGTVIDCYSFGIVDGELNAGELVGNNNRNSTVKGTSESCVIDPESEPTTGGLIGFDYDNR